MAQDPGSTLDTAKLIPVGANNRTVRQTLSATDNLDVWKIRVRASSFSVALKELGRRSNTTLYLLNSKAQSIVRPLAGRALEKKFSNLFLATGTYYIAVQLRGSANVRYTLTASAPTPTDFLGNSFDQAPFLNLSQAGLSFQEVLHNTDPTDFIEFRLPQPGRLNLTLKDLTANANLELYDANFRRIGQSSKPGTAQDNISQRLIDFGANYYIRISQAPKQEGVYTFNYTFTPDVPVTTATGLKYVDLIPGTGVTPTVGQTIVVQYTGTLENGFKFDSSRDRNQPFSFKLGVGDVIAGWDEGLSTMQVGGRRQLIIPSNLGYGPFGQGSIPPNSTLIFDVELLGIAS